MSGGHFNYQQYKISEIADEVERLIACNDSKETDRWGETIGYGFDARVIEKFQEGLRILRQAEIYAQRIDWLVSADDGEDSFLRRLQEDLEKLEFRS